MVVDWVPNRERRPAGRVSFAQTPAGVAGRVKLVRLRLTVSIYKAVRVVLGLTCLSEIII